MSALLEAEVGMSLFSSLFGTKEQKEAAQKAGEYAMQVARLHAGFVVGLKHAKSNEPPFDYLEAFNSGVRVLGEEQQNIFDHVACNESEEIKRCDFRRQGIRRVEATPDPRSR
jgi:hypothetical protein